MAPSDPPAAVLNWIAPPAPAAAVIPGVSPMAVFPESLGLDPAEILATEDFPRLEDVRALAPFASLTPPPATLEGTDGKVFLVGTPGDDVIVAGNSNSFIMALDGDDWVIGGPGNDAILGGPGNDILYGGEGNDSLDGGPGNDILYGGPGNDILLGGAGVNVLTGGEGRDVFRLGATPGDTLLAHPDLGPVVDGFSFITDFDAASGDLLNFSLVLRREAFQGLSSPNDLANYIRFEAVGADTQVWITTPQGSSTLEAMLLNVDPGAIAPSALSFAPPPPPTLL